MIALLLALALVLIVPAAVSAQGCEVGTPGTFFASPSGTSGGTGLTPASPIRIVDFWTKAAPFGSSPKTLCLAQGTYTTTAQMIRPPAGLSGTSTNRVTVRAITDGTVVLDRANATGESNYPLYLQGNQWFVLEGFDIYRGGDGPIILNNGAQNNILRRICLTGMADSTTTSNNASILVWTGSKNNLLEDICTSTSAQQQFIDIGSGTGPNTYRRLWMRWRGTTGPSPNCNIVEHNYDGLAGGSGSSILENSIYVWDGRNFSGSGCGGGATIGIMNRGPQDASDEPGYRFLGSLIYALNAGGTWDSPSIMVFTGGDGGGRHTFRDFYIDTGGSNATPLELTPCGGAGCGTAIANRVTTIRGASGNVIAAGWTVSPAIDDCTSVGACPSLFQTANPPTDAGMCYRYQDTVLTQQPLWPWPMDDRIKAALARDGQPALAGVAGDPGQGQTHGANTVTSEVIARYGAIPSACYGPGQPPPEPPPPGVFPTTALLDNFNRPDGPLGANWTTTFGSGMVISSAQAKAPDTSTFHGSSYTASSFGTDQEVWATITTPEPAGTGNHQIVYWKATGSTTRYNLGAVTVTGTNNDALAFYVFPAATEPCGSPAVQLGFDIAAGDQFGARTTGIWQEFWYKRGAADWTRVGVCAESSIQAGGNVGMATSGTGMYDNVGGGDVGSAPAGTNPPQQIQHPAVTQIVPITEIKKRADIP